MYEEGGAGKEMKTIDISWADLKKLYHAFTATYLIKGLEKLHITQT